MVKERENEGSGQGIRKYVFMVHVDGGSIEHRVESANAWCQGRRQANQCSRDQSQKPLELDWMSCNRSRKHACQNGNLRRYGSDSSNVSADRLVLYNMTDYMSGTQSVARQTAVWFSTFHDCEVGGPGFLNRVVQAKISTILQPQMT